MQDLLIEIASIDSKEFQSFMNIYGAEIESIFPHYSEEDAYYASIYLLKTAAKTIGVFIYQTKGDELHVDVDFIAEEQRDKGIGADFFKDQIGEFKKKGFNKVVALTTNSKHIEYLRTCDFERSVRHPDRFELDLK